MDIKVTSAKDDKYFDRKIINFSLEIKSKEAIKLSSLYRCAIPFTSPEP